MLRRFALTLLALTAHAADYTRDIQPLLAEHCLECHGPDDSKGGLVLTTLQAAVKELKARGAVFTMEPKLLRPGLRIAFLTGPEDVSIELLQRD
jgi:hypothetical protein